MPFNADLIGQTWGPIVWEATPRAILAYRAVLSPEDRAPLDDAAPGGLTALPMHCVTPEWALSLTLRGDVRQTLTADEGRRGVHAGQDSRFHRPVRAGETLAVTATLTGARESRAGVVVAVRYDGIDAQGATVWETVSSSLYRGVTLTGAGRGAEDRPDYGADLEGAASKPIHLAAGLPHLYSECADIWNPIHTERQVALAAGLSDIIVHGTALWALAGVALTDAHAQGDSARLRRLACAFVGQAIPGQTAVLRHASRGDHVAWRLDSETGSPLVVGRADFGLLNN